ncbi:hypothetical protein [Paenibacillus sp. FSL H7-0331]|uniref:hypothetical protein n=1 Tax=Paenibacillus sp. FSL H7-0331 TaxID=1920421 RepID=UPI00096D92DA|nr:hypothetical protein [Paenibacillus sp. FSL H7-0331]OMF11584.1 hypothetical protein BK127_24100 [Paenibacillus sp. FSL H7-0331]
MKNSNSNSAAGLGCLLVPLIIVLSPILFFIYMIDTYKKEIFFGPLYIIYASIKVLVLEVPASNFPYGVLLFLGVILYGSMMIPKIRSLYDELPVLIPFLQMCFLMLIASIIGFYILNAWADNQTYAKAEAVLLTVTTFVLMRLFMSYWYYSFPISTLITREEEQDIQAIQVNGGSVSQSSLPHGSMHKNLVLFALIFVFFLTMFFLANIPPTLDTNKLMKEQISREAAAGAILFYGEEKNGIQAKNFEVPGLTRSVSTRMLIWDYNLEDNDKVQILVDGKPIHDSIVLTNTPVAFTVPVPSVITIKGIQDQGGGLTYAVKFPQTKYTFFNIVAVNGVNTYTLMPTP